MIQVTRGSEDIKTNLWILCNIRCLKVNGSHQTQDMKLLRENIGLLLLFFFLFSEKKQELSLNLK